MKKSRPRTAAEAYPEESYYDDGALPPEDFDESEYVPEPEVVSTSQAINLTCTLAALSSLFALFLYFNDERSRAVRRLSVQSVGLGAIYLTISLALLACGLVFGFIPILGIVINLILCVSFMAATLVVVYFKIRMMKYAYRGYAYQLPGCGRWLRRFE